MIAATNIRGAALLAIIFLLAILIVAMVLLGLMIVSWRRHNARDRKGKRTTPMPDIWQAGGDRLVARLDDEKPDSGDTTDRAGNNDQS